MNNFPYNYQSYPYPCPMFNPYQQISYYPYYIMPFHQQIPNTEERLDNANQIEDQQLKEKRSAQVKIEAQEPSLSRHDDLLENQQDVKSNRKQRTIKKIQDNLYIPKKPKDNRQAINNLYTIKNIEANIVNQVYSFISNEQKCGPYVIKYFGQNIEKINKFNHYFKTIKKCNKRYIKKDYLVHLCSLSSGHLGYTKLMRNENYLKVLNIKQFCRCVRYLVRLYLNKLCPISILTSKKMNRNLWLRHLNKCRQINNYVFCSEEQRKLQQLHLKFIAQVDQKLQDQKQDCQIHQQ